MSGMVLPQILYDSALYRFRASLSYDGTIADGFDPINAADWLDFTLFRAETGTTNIKVQATESIVLRSFVAWLSETPPAGLTLYVETSPDDVTWTTRGTMVVAAAMTWLDLTSYTIASGHYLRIRIANGTGGAVDFRQLSVGPRLDFPIGQWAGIAPPTLYHGVVVDNVIAVNGSILGRNVRRLDKQGKLEINLLDPDWVRTYFDPLNRHAGRFAFWYRWHPVGYPTEIAFAAASDISAPVNEKPTNKMRVTIDMRMLTA